MYYVQILNIKHSDDEEFPYTQIKLPTEIKLAEVGKNQVEIKMFLLSLWVSLKKSENK